MARLDFPSDVQSRTIITYQGGITFTFAILSRKLNIPGIVGTGVATKVLRDGEKVEVYTKNGIVTKLERLWLN